MRLRSQFYVFFLHIFFVFFFLFPNRINIRSNSVDAATLQYNRISPATLPFQSGQTQPQMQVVPYTPQQKPSLAPEDLTKLYSMNTMVVQRHHAIMMSPQQPLTYQSPLQSNLMGQPSTFMATATPQQYYHSSSFISQTSSPMPGGLQPFNSMASFMRQPPGMTSPQITPSPVQHNTTAPQMFPVVRPSVASHDMYATAVRQNQFQRDLTPSPNAANTSIMTPLSQSNSTPTFNTYNNIAGGSGGSVGGGGGPSTSSVVGSLNASMNVSGSTELRPRRNDTAKRKGDNLIDLDFDTK